MKFPCQYRLLKVVSEVVVEFDSPCSGRVIKGGDHYVDGYYCYTWVDCYNSTIWERLGDPLPTFHVHPDHSRFLKVVFFENGVEKSMNIEVRYLGESNADNGCMMDSIIMPSIKEKLGVIDENPN